MPDPSAGKVRRQGSLRLAEILPVITYVRGESLRELSRHVVEGVGNQVEVCWPCHIALLSHQGTACSALFDPATHLCVLCW